MIVLSSVISSLLNAMILSFNFMLTFAVVTALSNDYKPQKKIYVITQLIDQSLQSFLCVLCIIGIINIEFDTTLLILKTTYV